MDRTKYPKNIDANSSFPFIVFEETDKDGDIIYYICELDKKDKITKIMGVTFNHKFMARQCAIAMKKNRE